MDQRLISKQYYETYIKDDAGSQEIQILAEKYLSERQNDSFDMASLFFAQGELYYHLKDYEVAIFKWEKVHNELQSWAHKNIADAYIELGRIPDAEAMYASIDTDDKTLKMEIFLQLFSMHITNEEFNAADTIIKDAVAFSPDYPDVTALARRFYEEQENWISAIDLAKEEALRTNSLEWFHVLRTYIDDGIAKNHSPRYFYESLLILSSLSRENFQQFIASLWKQYEGGDLYLEWLQMINEVFLNIQIDTQANWDTIASLFEISYQKLTEGDYPLKGIKEMMPDFFMNWLRITNPSQTLFASAATLAWNEIFPSQLNAYTVQDANDIFQHCSRDEDGFEYFTALFNNVINWAAKSKLSIAEELKMQGYETINHPTTSNIGKSKQLLDTLKKILLSIWEEHKKYENELNGSIAWNEDIVAKLEGFITNTKEMEQEKINAIAKSYSHLKEQLKKDLQENIPIILKSCREIITEESDFSRLHIELNEEMNTRVSEYLQERISHYFALDAHQWVTDSNREFVEVQTYLDEMCHSFNSLYQEEKLNLQLDFHILDDWHRDINRMTSRVKMDEINILLRFTPSQVLLKGAGKIISPIMQNKSMLYTRYKKYIKTRSYDDVIETILNNLFVQFELFESALDRDIAMLFDKIFKSQYALVKETNKNISTSKAILQKLLTSPEIYGDPLTLFDLRLQQYELMITPKQEMLQEER